jgi:uncharacterized iron-regulated protein
MRKYSVLFPLMCSLLASAQHKLNDSTFHVYSVREGGNSSLEKIVEAAGNYDVVFFGEEHNDSIGHQIERTLLDMMRIKYKGRFSLSLEMFDRDVQPIMNEYLKGFLREKTFIRDARAWNNYRDYRPLIELAKEYKMDVVCANAAGRYSNLAGRRGQKALMELPPPSKVYFAPLPYDTATGEYYRKLMELSGHSISASDTSKSKAPPMPMGSFNLVMAQSLWDATMAYSLAEYRMKYPDHKIFQVNGRFHSDGRFAVVEQLKKYSPSARVLVISTSPDESFRHPEWEKLKKLGDFIIVTDPAIPRTFTD